jgi:uncharacterized delta-60 repeat protein
VIDTSRPALATLAAAGLVLALAAPAPAAPQAGSLDRAFSGDGRIVQGFGGGFETVSTRDVLVTSTGKVVTVAALTKPGAAYWGIARMRADGSPDASFRGNGRRTTAFEHDDVPHRVISQGNGRILVGGSGGDAFAVASHDKDGSPNATFGGDGKVTTDVTPGLDYVTDLRVLSGGKILAAGFAGDQFATVRYLPTGVPDDTFGGGDGIVLTTDGFDGKPYAARLQSDGKLVVVGETDPYDGFALTRFDTDGSLDDSFGGGDGRVETGAPGDTERALANAVAFQPDGRIVIGGRTFGPGDSAKFAVARFLDDGTPDESFSGDGVAFHQFQPFFATVHALAVQPDGKIVAAGWTDQQSATSDTLAVARYRSNGTLDPSFSGNGKAAVAYGERGRAAAAAVAVRGSRVVAVGEVEKPGSTRGIVVAFRR